MTTTISEPAVARRVRPLPVTLVVTACSLLAMATRLPGIRWSPSPDEAGFTLVARAWEPTADSPYGRYWVDRPPPLIALVRLTDALGGVHAIRVVAAVGCALLVLAAAGVAREAAATGARAASDRAVVLTVLGTTALVGNASIDPTHAKGEVLSLPLLVGSAWLVLRAVRTRSVAAAVLAGLCAGSAVGLKQNLVEGIVVGGVVLAGEAVRRTLSTGELARLGGAFLAACLVPAAATVAWALAAGVRLSALWYSTYGFRGDALDVILAGPPGAPLRRAAHLVLLAVTTGLVVLFGWFLLSLRRLLRDRPVLTPAALAVLVVAAVSLALGGSYWRPYLFELVPAAVLCLALLSSVPATPPTTVRPRVVRDDVVTDLVVALLVVTSVVSAALWARTWTAASKPSTAHVVGSAIATAARPGDTLTVWGGGAQVQLASGLGSPYDNLWSLPARTRDPGSHHLAAVLDGPAAPTWFLAWSRLDGWRDGTSATLAPVLRERYVRVARACGGRDLYRRRDAQRPAPVVDCAAVRAARAVAHR